MISLLVDESKCKRDGICVSECPARLFELEDGSPAPTWVVGAEEMCVECGHCVAVCPRGAISLSTMPVEQCLPVQRYLFFTPAQVEQHLRARRSVRDYESKPVPREELARLIDAARFAPSAGNSQPVRWLVVYDQEDVKALAGHTVDWVRSSLDTLGPLDLLRREVEFWDAGEDLMIAGNAPHLIFTVAPKAGSQDLVDFNQVGCAIALTYLELAAPAFGLGTCWGGILMMAANGWPPLRQALGLTDEQACCGAMMVGYPRRASRRIPLRNPARVTWL